jgi:hypothetical protein
VNCCFVPSAIEAVPGVTVINVSADGVTVRVPEPVIPLEAAVMFATPKPVLVVRPAEFTVAAVVSLEVQLAMPVKSCVLPSEYVPMAANCCFVPNAIDMFGGETAIEVSAAAVTIRVVDPVTDPEFALIMVCP